MKYLRIEVEINGTEYRVSAGIKEDGTLIFPAKVEQTLPEVVGGYSDPWIPAHDPMIASYMQSSLIAAHTYLSHAENFQQECALHEVV